MTNLIHRMRVAVQATSDTYSSSDRTALHTEYAQLEDEIIRLTTDTKWNTMKLLDGSLNNGTFLIQVGADGGMTISVALDNWYKVRGCTKRPNNLNVSTQATAAYAVVD